MLSRIVTTWTPILLSCHTLDVNNTISLEEIELLMEDQLISVMLKKLLGPSFNYHEAW